MSSDARERLARFAAGENLAALHGPGTAEVLIAALRADVAAMLAVSSSAALAVLESSRWGSRDELLYFGMRTRGNGHDLTDEHGRRRRDVGWMESLDGKLPPRGERQEEGVAAVHFIHGWTAVAWWDRSGDTRMGSNSVVWMRGIHDAVSVLQAARERLPWLFARLSYEVRLAAPAGGEG